MDTNHTVMKTLHVMQVPELDNEGFPMPNTIDNTGISMPNIIENKGFSMPSYSLHKITDNNNKDKYINKDKNQKKMNYRIKKKMNLYILLLVYYTTARPHLNCDPAVSKSMGKTGGHKHKIG